MEAEGEGERLGVKLRRWSTDLGVVSIGIWIAITAAAVVLALLGVVNPVATIAISSTSTIVLFIAGQAFRHKKHSTEIEALKSQIESNNEAHKKELRSNLRRHSRAITAASDEAREQGVRELELFISGRQPHIRHALMRHLELVYAVGQAVSSISSMATATHERCGNQDITDDLRILLMDLVRELTVLESALGARLDVSRLNLGDWRRIDQEVVEETIRDFEANNGRGNNG